MADEFEYSGYLVFTPFILTPAESNLPSGSGIGIPVQEFQSRYNSYKIDILELPLFSPGDPEDPGEGFEQEFLTNYFMSTDASKTYNEHLSDIDYFKHKKENFERKNVYVEGELTKGYVKSIESTDIFQLNPGILFFRGTKKSVKYTSKYLRNLRRDDVSIDHLRAPPHYLSKLYHNPGALFRDFPIELASISTVRFEGGEEIEEVKISVGSSSFDVRDQQNIPKNQYPISIEAVFRFNNTKIWTTIQNKRIHIQTSKGDLADYSPISRITYSVSLLRYISLTILNHQEQKER